MKRTIISSVVKRSASSSKTSGSSAFPSVITRNTFFASVRSVSAKSCSLANLIAFPVNAPWSKSTLLSLIIFKDKTYDKRNVIVILQLGMCRSQSFGKQFSIIIRSLHLIADIIHFIKYKAYYKITRYCYCDVLFICFETCLFIPQVLKLGGVKGFSGGASNWVQADLITALI